MISDPTRRARQQSELSQMVGAALQRPEAGENPYRVVLRQVRQRLTATSDPYELSHPAEATRQKVETLTRQITADYRLAQPVQGLPVLDLADDEIVRRIVSDVLGFGPLDPLPRDERIRWEARIVCLAPFTFIVILRQTAPDLQGPFYASIFGQIAIVLVGVMSALAYYFMNRLGARAVQPLESAGVSA